MTTETEQDRRPAAGRIAVAAVVAVGVAIAAWAVWRPGSVADYPAPGLAGPVDAAALSANGYRVLPQVLQRIYAAFGETGEEAIYDGLASVASDGALESLYLERVGAMAEAGLEPDQQIHEMELIRLSSRPQGERVTMAAEWRVLGTVGHAEHLHVRGNAYSADLVLEPVEGAWRLTGFTLRDVDRTGAGTTTDRVDGPWTGGADEGSPDAAGASN